MFGMLRPCRNRLGERLRADWTAHLCGMCLALRDAHGHLARAVTNVDALVLSALVEAQSPAPARRRAGPCALRGMRSASVADGAGAQLAASVSLLLAATELADHVADGDVRGTLPVRATAGLARRCAAAGNGTARSVGFDPARVLGVLAAQPAVEAAAGSLLEVTAPTEAATAAAFAHTAALAGRPGNAGALGEAGRLFGRLAHLLDAVEDVHADRTVGAWNPLTAFAVSPAQARRWCDDAVLGIRLALAEASFTEPALVHALLVHETAAAVDRVFREAGQPRATSPAAPPPGAPPDPAEPGGNQPSGWEPPSQPPQRRNPLLGCVGWLVLCGTCQACCRSSYTDPCTGEEREGACRGCGGADCSDCVDCGDCCCDCGDCCDCGC